MIRLFAAFCVLVAIVFTCAIIHWSLTDAGELRTTDFRYVAMAVGSIAWLNLNLHAALPITHEQPQYSHGKEQTQKQNR